MVTGTRIPSKLFKLTKKSGRERELFLVGVHKNQVHNHSVLLRPTPVKWKETCLLLGQTMGTHTHTFWSGITACWLNRWLHLSQGGKKKKKPGARTHTHTLWHDSRLDMDDNESALVPGESEKSWGCGRPPFIHSALLFCLYHQQDQTRALICACSVSQS